MRVELQTDLDQQPFDDLWWDGFKQGQVKLVFSRMVQDEAGNVHETMPDCLAPFELAVVMESLLAQEADQGGEELEEEPDEVDPFGMTLFPPPPGAFMQGLPPGHPNPFLMAPGGGPGFTGMAFTMQMGMGGFPQFFYHPIGAGPGGV